jgi:hypothetical protein
MFGLIADVEVDAAGNIFVLDDQTLAVRWFSPDGEFMGSAGGKGAGPGEFRAPVGLTVDPAENVQVLDMAFRRISVFQPTDSSFALVREMSTDIHALDMCLSHGRRYLLSPIDSLLVHEVNDSGSIVRSFGSIGGEPIPPELEPHARMLLDSRARGRLLCDDADSSVVVVREQTPLVQAFSLDGAPLWERDLEGFAERQWVAGTGRSGRPSLSMAPEPVTKSVHTTMAVARVFGGHVAISLLRNSMEDLEGTLEVRVLSHDDGSTIASHQVELVLAGVQGSLVYGFANAPFPRVFVLNGMPFPWRAYQ